jgi:hypothetical protein
LINLPSRRWIRAQASNQTLSKRCAKRLLRN